MEPNQNSNQYDMQKLPSLHFNAKYKHVGS